MKPYFFLNTQRTLAHCGVIFHHRQQGFDRALEQSLDSVRAKAKWVARDGDDVHGWLESKGFVDTGAA